MKKSSYILLMVFATVVVFNLLLITINKIYRPQHTSLAIDTTKYRLLPGSGVWVNKMAFDTVIDGREMLLDTNTYYGSKILLRARLYKRQLDTVHLQLKHAISVIVMSNNGDTIDRYTDSMVYYKDKQTGIVAQIRTLDYLKP